MKLIRTFHSVGQGLCCSEQIINDKENKNFTIVYDCGGDAHLIKNVVNKFSKVDYIVISHFHLDHISGIHELKQKNNDVKLYYPHLSPKLLLLDFIYCLHQYKNSNKGIRLNDIIMLFKNTLDFQNHNNSEIYDPNEIITFHFIHIDEDIERKIKDPKYQKLRTSLSEEFGIEIDTKIDNNIIDKLSKYYEKVSDIYKNIYRGCHNQYSMCMLSELEMKVKRITLNFMNEERIYFNTSGKLFGYYTCLYTGDCEPDKNEKLIGCTFDIIQVPHHGAKANYVDWLYENSKIAVVSAGENNNYRHPSGFVTEKIRQQNNELYWVSDTSGDLVLTYELEQDEN